MPKPSVLVVADRTLAAELGLQSEMAEGILLLDIDPFDTFLNQLEALGDLIQEVVSIILVTRCSKGGMQIGLRPITTVMVRTTREAWSRTLPVHLENLDLFLVQGVIPESLPMELATASGARVRLADACRPGALQTMADGNKPEPEGLNGFRPFRRPGA